jgi:hypothetical protein
MAQQWPVWTYIFFFQPLCSFIYHPTLWKKVQCPANSCSLSDLVPKRLIQVLNLLWRHWYLGFTYQCSILKSSWRSCETVFGNFPLISLVHTALYNSHSHSVPLWFCLQPGFTAIWWIAPLWQHLTTDPSSVSCNCNFSTTQHAADPSLQCVTKPMPFCSLCYVTLIAIITFLII